MLQITGNLFDMHVLPSTFLRVQEMRLGKDKKCSLYKMHGHQMQMHIRLYSGTRHWKG